MLVLNAPALILSLVNGVFHKKNRYIHNNLVVEGLVFRPED